MLKSLEINNFRKFDNLKIDELKRINLILGNNNSGKTSLLEAIYTYSCGKNLNQILSNVLTRDKIDNIGNYDLIERILNLFNNKEDLIFELKGIEDNQVDYEFKHQVELGSQYEAMIPNSHMINTKSNINNKIFDWNISERNITSKNRVEGNMPKSLNNIKNVEPHLFATFNDILTHRNQQENTIIYSKLKRTNLFNEFKENMIEVFGEIEDIDSIPYPDGTPSPVSIKYKNSDLLPLYSFGDGHQRWFNILGNMMVNKNAVICIEEIDSTFHYKAQKDLCKNIVKYANKFNCQVFLTSHSIEFVDNFLEGISELNDKELLDEVNIITLKSNSKGQSKARILSGTEAIKTREDYSLELR
ncbi:MAG: AAA family ATPase [Romboutsia sp.]|uniref:AAA family ATPase n=1 Tax=Romboutsia sp. TaxID=1965302 RepID=UPI003F3D2AAD